MTLLKKLSILPAILVSSSVFAIDFFDGSFEEAIELAKKENKLIFMDAYTTWCGPCKKLDRETFPREDVSKFFEENFINIKIDMEDEDQNGPELAKRYNVTAYPTLLFIESTGEFKDRVLGFQEGPVLIEEAKKILSSNVTLSQFKQKVTEGKISAPEMLEHLIKFYPIFAAMDKESKEKNITFFENAIEKYLEKTNDKDKFNKEIYDLVTNYFPEASRGIGPVEFIISHHKEFEKSIPAQELSAFVCRVSTGTIKALAEKGDKGYLKYVEEARKELAPVYKNMKAWFSGVDPADMLQNYGDTAFSLSSKDWQGYIDSSKKIAELMGDDIKPEQMVDYVGTLLNAGCYEPKYLKQTVEFCKKAYEQKKNIKTASVYAILQSKLKDSSANNLLREAMVLCNNYNNPVAKDLFDDLQKELVTLEPNYQPVKFEGKTQKIFNDNSFDLIESRLILVSENHTSAKDRKRANNMIEDAKAGKYFVAQEGLMFEAPPADLADGESLLFGMEEELPHALSIMGKHTVMISRGIKKLYGEERRLNQYKAQMLSTIVTNPYVEEAWKSLNRPFEDKMTESIAKNIDIMLENKEREQALFNGELSDEKRTETTFYKITRGPQFALSNNFHKLSYDMTAALAKLAEEKYKDEYNVPSMDSLYKLINNPESLEAEKEYAELVVIGWRNDTITKNLIKLYKRAQGGKKDLKVLIGAAHSADLKKRLESQLGIRVKILNQH